MPRGSAAWQALDEALAPDHEARQVDAFVDALDLAALRDRYLGVGSPAHRPELMLKLALYEALRGRLSPREWHRDLADSTALRWLGQGIRPSRSALYAFRDRLGDVLAELHAQVIRRAVADGLTAADRGVLDGTAVRACASRHRLLHDERLGARHGRLEEALRADAAAEPVADPPAWMATTPAGRRAQAERFARARCALDGHLAANRARPKDKRLDPRHVVVSTSDPEAALGRDKEKVFGPLYTAQWVVDPDSLLVLAYAVFPQPTDAGTLPTMLDRTRAVTGRSLAAMTTDAGYVSVLDLRACAARGVTLYAPVPGDDPTAPDADGADGGLLGKDRFTWRSDEQTYACPAGHLLEPKGWERRRRRGGQELPVQRFVCPPEHCRACPLQARCTRRPERGRTVKRLEGEELLEDHRRRMAAPAAKAAVRRRGAVIERSFGDAKEHRKLRRLHGRGLRRARAEVGLVVLAQTAVMLRRLRQRQATPCETAS